MTKEEFLEKWGYKTAKGYGQALFDCKAELEKDLLLAFGIFTNDAKKAEYFRPDTPAQYPTGEGKVAMVDHTKETPKTNFVIDTKK